MPRVGRVALGGASATKRAATWRSFSPAAPMYLIAVTSHAPAVLLNAVNHLWANGGWNLEGRSKINSEATHDHGRNESIDCDSSESKSKSAYEWIFRDEGCHLEEKHADGTKKVVAILALANNTRFRRKQTMCRPDILSCVALCLFLLPICSAEEPSTDLAVSMACGSLNRLRRVDALGAHCSSVTKSRASKHSFVFMLAHGHIRKGACGIH